MAHDSDTQEVSVLNFQGLHACKDCMLGLSLILPRSLCHMWVSVSLVTADSVPDTQQAAPCDTTFVVIQTSVIFLLFLAMDMVLNQLVQVLTS